MAISSAAQAAQAATQAGTNTTTTTPVQPLPNVSFSGPGAGIYLEKQNQAELAYKQAMAELLQKKNTAYHEYGLNAQGAVDPLSQFGRYQSLLSRHESDLSAAAEAAQQRSLGGLGLANQAERALRYQQGSEDLSLQQEIGDVASGYASGSQAALLARNQAIIDAQLDSLRMNLSYGSGSGAGGSGSGNAGLEVGNGNDAFRKGGYTDEQVFSAADAYAKARGWPVRAGGYEVAHNGVIETVNGKRGIWIKFDTPQGSSTEFIELGDPQNDPNKPPANNPPPPPTNPPPAPPPPKPGTPVQIPGSTQWTVPGSGIRFE